MFPSMLESQSILKLGKQHLLLRSMVLYLCDQQLYVLFKAVQEPLQRAGVGGAALPSTDFWQSSMFVCNLSQNLEGKTQKSGGFFL